MPEVRRHYRLEHQEWSQVWKDLRPSEIRILYHLRTLDPFGDRKLNIKVRQMGRDLGMAHSTVSKALKVLDDKGYIELDLVEVDLKILSKAGVVPGGTTGSSRNHPRSPGTDRFLEEPLGAEALNSEMLAVGASEPFSPENQNLPEQTLKNSVKQNRAGAWHLSNQEENSAILDIVPNEAGVPLNPALASVLKEIEQKHPEEAQDKVRSAVTAYLEQRETVKNPQAFISAALQRGFTSNKAKRKKTKTAEQTLKKTTIPQPPAQDLSDAIAAISRHCNRLGITSQQALERFGTDKSFNDLTPLELTTLQDAMARWPSHADHSS